MAQQRQLHAKLTEREQARTENQAHPILTILGTILLQTSHHLTKIKNVTARSPPQRMLRMRNFWQTDSF
jgi:hypothetical protein